MEKYNDTPLIDGREAFGYVVDLLEENERLQKENKSLQAKVDLRDQVLERIQKELSTKH